MWPAALGLFAFVWMELVYPHNATSAPVRLWCGVYVAVMLIGGALFGNTFYARADPFEVYSTPGRAGCRSGAAATAQLVLRSPLANLDTTPRPRAGRRGRGAVRQHGVRRVQGLHALADVHPGHRHSTYLQNNLGLLGFCLAVGLIFWLGCIATGRRRRSSRARELPDAVRALGGADRASATSSPTT